MRTPGAELYPELAPFSGREIEDVDITGNGPIAEDTLESLLETEETHCAILGFLCVPFTDIGREVHRVSLERLRGDVNRLQLFYRSEGYFGTIVEPEVEDAGGDPDAGPVRVTFRIRPGDPVRLDNIAVEGTEGILDPDSLARRLPSQEGDLFDLGDFAASADSVLAPLLRRGHAYAQVLRNFGVDTVTDRATALLVAIPGPVVVVDSVVVIGAENLGRKSTMRQLTFRQGDLLEAQRLSESQRNLYVLELVQFATVTVAPDSLQLTPADSTTATVAVRVSEAPVYVVDATAGWGTLECGRTSLSWTSRSFTGGARRLLLTSSLTKIGVGEPLDLGVAESLCRALPQDPFAHDLDYRFAAELTQPYFISPRNQLVGTVFTERQSEPVLFQRTALGGRAALTHRFDPRQLGTAAIEVERRKTQAVPALFCFTFRVCAPQDLEALAESRWRNALTTSYVRDRSTNPINPVGGYQVRSSATWATPALMSDYDFLRWTGEAAVYRRLSERWVLGGFLRLGSFFGTASLTPGSEFLPPEERFFTGGANSVRGFDRNRLGPGLYVADEVVAVGDTAPPPHEQEGVDIQFSPSGGTSLMVASTELRFPSPVLRDLLRLAAFVDAGVVGTRELWDVVSSDVRVTPGLGLRVQTPVGPARVDVAYNPYPPQTAPLFHPLPGPERGLEQVLPAYQPPDRASFWQRLRFHIAVGQAF